MLSYIDELRRISEFAPIGVLPRRYCKKWGTEVMEKRAFEAGMALQKVDAKADILADIMGLWREGVCLVDEVDMVLHPLRSETNFPIGQKQMVDLHPHRWNLAMHMLDAAVAAGRPPYRTSVVSRDVQAAAALKHLVAAVKDGIAMNDVQSDPHMVLMSADFYPQKLQTHFGTWALIFLMGQSVVRRVLCLPDTHATEDLSQLERDVRAAIHAFLMHEDTDAIVVAQLSNPRPGSVNNMLKQANSSNDIQPSEISSATKMLNLARDWVCSYLPHCLGKRNRVDYGLLSAGDITGWWNPEAAEAVERKHENKEHKIFEADEVESWTGHFNPRSRKLLAVPFAGKDSPSPKSEFSSPEVLIGLTFLAYRYSGLRKYDLYRLTRKLNLEMATQPGPYTDRPAYRSFASWLRVAQDIREEIGSTEDPADFEVLSLDLFDPEDPKQMVNLHRTLAGVGQTSMQYMQDLVFPEVLQHQTLKLQASGMDIGSDQLFGTRLGFSGTPSDLLPYSLGSVGTQPGTDAKVLRTLTSPQYVSLPIEGIPAGWSAETILDQVAAAEPLFHAMVDAGALITGFSNEGTAQYLLNKLPSSIKGCAFLDASDRTQVVMRKGGRVMTLEACGLQPEERFSFYDQVHSTGTDIKQCAQARCAVTLGKGMTLRDLAQGAWRMRGLTIGQTVELIVVPSVRKQVGDALDVPDEATRLRAVVEWLLENSAKTEQKQYMQLIKQQAANLWRSEAFDQLLASRAPKLLPAKWTFDAEDDGDNVVEEPESEPELELEPVAEPTPKCVSCDSHMSWAYRSSAANVDEWGCDTFVCRECFCRCQGYRWHCPKCAEQPPKDTDDGPRHFDMCGSCYSAPKGQPGPILTSEPLYVSRFYDAGQESVSWEKKMRLEAELITQICKARKERDDDMTSASNVVVRKMLAKPDGTEYKAVSEIESNKSPGKTYYVDAPKDATVHFCNTPCLKDRSPEDATDGSAQTAINETAHFIMVREKRWLPKQALTLAQPEYRVNNTVNPGKSVPLRDSPSFYDYSETTVNDQSVHVADAVTANFISVRTMEGSKWLPKQILIKMSENNDVKEAKETDALGAAEAAQRLHTAVESLPSTTQVSSAFFEKVKAWTLRLLEAEADVEDLCKRADVELLGEIYGVRPLTLFATGDKQKSWAADTSRCSTLNVSLLTHRGLLWSKSGMKRIATAAQDNWDEPRVELQSLGNSIFSVQCGGRYLSTRARSEIAVGARVRVKLEVSKPKFGWGPQLGKHRDEFGVVVARSRDVKNVCFRLTVDFPCHQGWVGNESDVELEPRKFTEGEEVVFCGDYPQQGLLPGERAVVTSLSENSDGSENSARCRLKRQDGTELEVESEALTSIHDVVDLHWVDRVFGDCERFQVECQDGSIALRCVSTGRYAGEDIDGKMRATAIDVNPSSVFLLVDRSSELFSDGHVQIIVPHMTHGLSKCTYRAVTVAEMTFTPNTSAHIEEVQALIDTDEQFRLSPFMYTDDPRYCTPGTIWGHPTLKSTGNGSERFVVLDMGEPRQYSRLILTNEGEEHDAKRLEVECAEDTEGPWKVVCSVEAQKIRKPQEFDFTASPERRWWRVTVVESHSDSLGEMTCKLNFGTDNSKTPAELFRELESCSGGRGFIELEDFVKWWRTTMFKSFGSLEVDKSLSESVYVGMKRAWTRIADRDLRASARELSDDTIGIWRVNENDTGSLNVNGHGVYAMRVDDSKKTAILYRAKETDSSDVCCETCSTSLREHHTEESKPCSKCTRRTQTLWHCDKCNECTCSECYQQRLALINLEPTGGPYEIIPLADYTWQLVGIPGIWHVQGSCRVQFSGEDGSTVTMHLSEHDWIPRMCTRYNPKSAAKLTREQDLQNKRDQKPTAFAPGQYVLLLPGIGLSGEWKEQEVAKIDDSGMNQKGEYKVVRQRDGRAMRGTFSVESMVAAERVEVAETHRALYVSRSLVPRKDAAQDFKKGNLVILRNGLTSLKGLHFGQLAIVEDGPDEDGDLVLKRCSDDRVLKYFSPRDLAVPMISTNPESITWPTVVGLQESSPEALRKELAELTVTALCERAAKCGVQRPVGKPEPDAELHDLVESIVKSSGWHTGVTDVADFYDFIDALMQCQPRLTLSMTLPAANENGVSAFGFDKDHFLTRLCFQRGVSVPDDTNNSTDGDTQQEDRLQLLQPQSRMDCLETFKEKLDYEISATVDPAQTIDEALKELQNVYGGMLTSSRWWVGCDGKPMTGLTEERVPQQVRAKRIFDYLVTEANEIVKAQTGEGLMLDAEMVQEQEQEVEQESSSEADVQWKLVHGRRDVKPEPWDLTLLQSKTNTNGGLNVSNLTMFTPFAQMRVHKRGMDLGQNRGKDETGEDSPEQQDANLLSLQLPEHIQFSDHFAETQYTGDKWRRLKSALLVLQWIHYVDDDPSTPVVLHVAVSLSEAQTIRRLLQEHRLDCCRFALYTITGDCITATVDPNDVKQSKHIEQKRTSALIGLRFFNNSTYYQKDEQLELMKLLQTTPAKVRRDFLEATMVCRRNAKGGKDGSISMVGRDLEMCLQSDDVQGLIQ